jgi:hypothetical protein
MSTSALRFTGWLIVVALGAPTIAWVAFSLGAGLASGELAGSLLLIMAGVLVFLFSAVGGFILIAFADIADAALRVDEQTRSIALSANALTDLVTRLKREA